MKGAIWITVACGALVCSDVVCAQDPEYDDTLQGGAVQGGAENSSMLSGSSRRGSFWYPTDVEEPRLGGSTGSELYTRGGSTNTLGPDTKSLTKTGLWEYPQPEMNFYERHDEFFGPLENFLTVFVPGEGVYVGRSKSRSESDYVDVDPELVGGVYLDFGLPFTRRYNPDRAHLKLGPSYFDLLSITAAMLYSDLDAAPATRALYPDDGWIGALELTARGLIRFTDNVYLSAVGTVYYLDSGRVGFYFGNGNDANTRLRVNFGINKEVGDWEFLIFDQFRTHYYLYDLYDDVEDGEIVQSGRYRFGRDNPRTAQATDYYNDDQLYFVNDAGAVAYWDDETEWRLRVAGWRRDTWRTNDFIHTQGSYYGSLFLTYDRQDWRFAPFFEYWTRYDDDPESWRHVFWLGVQGPLSQNTNLLARVGYVHTDGVQRSLTPLPAFSTFNGVSALSGAGLFADPFLNLGEIPVTSIFSPVNSSSLADTNVDRWLWEIGVSHELGPNTEHSLFGGAVAAEDAIGDTYVANYVRYTIFHSFTERLRASFWGQYADFQNLDAPRGFDGNGVGIAALVSYALGDFGNISLRTLYDDINYDLFPDLTRGIYSATLTHRLMSRLWASVSYQYSDYNFVTPSLDFDEHLYVLRLTRYF